MTQNMPESEVQLTGGNVTPVVWVGDTVHRGTGLWTPAVHALLGHLEAVGFDAAPRVLGFDSQGREVLTYIEGEVGAYPLPEYMWSDKVLGEAARLLRRLHDATASFPSAPSMSWQLPYPDPEQHDVICHNDFAPYNCVYVDHHLRALIDFDTAGPGPRIWDLAYAAYRFVPLHEEPRWFLSEQARRLRLFCEEYGLQERAGLVGTIERRVGAIRDLILDRAAAGDTVFQRHLAEGHAEGYDRDRSYIRRIRQELESSLEGGA